MTLGMAGLAILVLFLHACTVNAPAPASPNVPSTTDTNNNIPGTVAINDASTGTCPINAWLDATGPVTVHAGSVYTFNNVAYGPHTLTFNTTSTVSCGGPATCLFINGGVTQTGYACAFYMYSGGVTETAAITDNGCNLLTMTCPDW